MTEILPFYISASGEQKKLVADSAFRCGLLETMRAHNGSIPLWPLHRERLIRSAGLEDDAIQFIAEAVSAAAGRTKSWPRDARVRLRYGMISGVSSAQPYWDISIVPLAEPSGWENGVVLGICQTRLRAIDTLSPFLPATRNASSGSKHGDALGCKLLTRSRYVQAAAEWSQKWPNASARGPILEPVLLAENGAVIEGVRSNLLLRMGGRWLVPRLDQYGVRGVMLRWLAGQTEIGEDTFKPSDLARADELAVCNSVRGVVPARLVSAEECSPSFAGERGNPLQAPVEAGEATAALQSRISESLW